MIKKLEYREMKLRYPLYNDEERPTGQDIEKIGYITPENEEIVDKINEIIDFLNSLNI